MKTKKSLLLIFVLALVATACGGGSATPCDEVEITTGENGLPDLDGCEFTFAVENAYLPFNYIDAADGEAKGWDYDVFNHMGELMNFVPVYVPAAWDGMIQAVADGQFMVAGDGITITAERDEIIDFSDGYINLAQRVLVATGNTDITSIDDLKNGDYTVATQKVQQTMSLQSLSLVKIKLKLLMTSTLLSKLLFLVMQMHQSLMKQLD